MLRRTLVVLCFGFMTLLMTSCGQTYELQSITISPSQPNVEGISNNLPLTVTAHYSNTKTQDVTAAAKYVLVASGAPQAGLIVNTSGILETTNVPACTWVSTLNSDKKSYSYAIVNPYVLTATYSGLSVPASVSVASAADCWDGIGFVRPPPA